MKKVRKTVLITGAYGYIGKNLHEQLSHDYTLLTPSKRDLNLLDTRGVEHYFRNTTIDSIIHCAVSGSAHPKKHCDAVISQNLTMFLNILRCIKKNQTLIHMGSGAEYDKSRSLHCVKESDFGKWIPEDDYGLYKYICSKMIQEVQNAVVLRIFGLFGKYEDTDCRFISYAIIQALKGLPIVINQNVFFEYVYIDDFVRIVRYFLNHRSKNRYFNIGSGRKIDLLTIAKMVRSITHSTSKIIVKHSGLGKEYTCDVRLLYQEISTLKFLPIEHSLRQLIGYYTKTLSAKT